LDKNACFYGNSHDHNRINSIGLWIIGAAVWDCHYDLFFVFAAILKVVCEEFEELKPIALIIAEKNKKG
jgi:hypothetical protein